MDEKRKANTTRVIIGTALVILGLYFIFAGVQSVVKGYTPVFPALFPPEFIFGGGNFAVGVYVLLGGSWKDFFQVIRF